MGELIRPRDFRLSGGWWMVIAGCYALLAIALLSFGHTGWALPVMFAFGYSLCNVLNLGYLTAQDRKLEEFREYFEHENACSWWPYDGQR